MWVRFCPVPKTQSTLFVSGIVSADDLGALGGKPGFPGDEGQAVRSIQRAEVDGRERLLCDEVNHREGVIASAAVIGDVGGLAVGRGDDFVGIFEDWNSRDDLQRGGVDNGERPVALGEHEQRGLGRGLSVGARRWCPLPRLRHTKYRRPI